MKTLVVTPHKDNAEYPKLVWHADTGKLMKTTISNSPINSNFPKLMWDPEDATIVLFTQPKCGTVVHKGSNSSKNIFPGVFKTVWEMSFFQDFNDTLTLEN